MVNRTAVVVGSGPNGLAAGIELARAGYSVEVREAADVPGGGCRSAEWTLPGFTHDCCSAVHPFALASPYFSRLNLEKFGVQWIWSPAEIAHPLDDGSAVLLWRNFDRMQEQVGSDAAAWRKMFQPFAGQWSSLAADVLSPLRIPRSPVLMARFGLQALQSVTAIARTRFQGERARALFGGVGAHSIKPLDSPLSAAIAVMLIASGHAVGWPIPRKGAQSITKALVRALESYGGHVVTGSRVNSLRDVIDADLVFLDVTPKQVAELGRGLLSAGFDRQLKAYKYGPGAYKVDWALSDPIPWRARECRESITVHLGGNLEEMERSERAAWEGQAPVSPFVLLAQQSLFDPARAPEGKHTAWAYCHVPNGWTGSAVDLIEGQVERFAPGFRDCILARAVHGPNELQAMNENLVGGDINGGAFTVKQFALRPTWREYGTPLKNVFLCSSSTLPGGGVHGMCGYNATRFALKRVSA